ncbi:conserved protein of unknown function [Petrocella atlantisensis]|uniref:Uncharacterized protein n=1 Tax=Petrocella atlantisensis TaxID=2173034 RepID=A0A3P7P176_9FIRM|nr:hypothetical protein [Petrocella atlantisensis]VDN49124.1 conserved protein of unknown function [Petrocella atlantisensis]
MGKFEDNIINILEEIIGEEAIHQKTFDWLCNSHLVVEDNYTNKLLDKIFISLGGNLEGLSKKRSTKLKVDAFFSGINCIFEIDELQHFTTYRLNSLNLIKEYEHMVLGFDLDNYINYCEDNYKNAVRKGQKGYRRKTKDFPNKHGRAIQRAYFDSLRDLVVPIYLEKPVIRLSEFELLQMDTRDIKWYIADKISRYI